MKKFTLVLDETDAFLLMGILTARMVEKKDDLASILEYERLNEEMFQQIDKQGGPSEDMAKKYGGVLEFSN